MRGELIINVCQLRDWSNYRNIFSKIYDNVSQCSYYKINVPFETAEYLNM